MTRAVKRFSFPKLFLTLWCYLIVVVVVAATNPSIHDNSHALVRKHESTEVSDAFNEKSHVDRIKESILALGEADNVDPNLSMEQRRLDTMKRALLQLPAEELSYLPISLTPETVILEGSSEAELLLQAWTQRQLALQEALKSMVKPVEAMTKLMVTLGAEIEEMRRLVPTTATAKEHLTKILDLFVALEDFVSDLDNARDFHTLQLWPTLTSYLHPAYPLPVRSYAAWTIGSAVNGIFSYSLTSESEGKITAEHHKWLLDPVILSLRSSDEVNNVSTNALELLTRLFTESADLLVHSPQISENQDIVNAVKKSLYALTAALRGSFEVQVELAERLQISAPDAVAYSLWNIATLGNRTFSENKKLTSLGSMGYGEWEAIRRVWAFGADLAQELVPVIEELRSITLKYIELKRVNGSEESTIGSEIGSELVTQAALLVQAQQAMGSTPFLYPKLFLQSELAYSTQANSVLSHIFEAQTNLLSSATECSEQNLLQTKQYSMLRSMRREMLRFILTQSSLARMVFECEQMSPSLSLWKDWAGIDAASSMETANLRRILFEVKRLQQMEADILRRCSDDMKSSEGDAIGYDEALSDWIAQCESELTYHEFV